MEIQMIARGGLAVLTLVALLTFANSPSAQPRGDTRPTAPPSVRVDPDRRCATKVRVNTPNELVTILESNFVGCVIIPKDVKWDMSPRKKIPLHSGVSLIGERGELGSRPKLYTDSKAEDYCLFDTTSNDGIASNDVRVAGLHFRGPANGNRSAEQHSTFAICVYEDPVRKLGRRIVIADNEFDEWTTTAVQVDSTLQARTPAEYRADFCPNVKKYPDDCPRIRLEDAGLVRIEHNYIHHNARDGKGYGVQVGSGAYATIEGNVFDFNRHALASDGYALSGYVARFNYVLQGGFKHGSGYTPPFDVHGTNLRSDGSNSGYGGPAGEYYEIAFNTIRGEQSYGRRTRSAFALRGAPTSGAYFHDNVVVHNDLDAAVTLKWESGDSGFGGDHEKFRFHASGNQFDTDHSGELATGDFDGDGRTDVFVANGTAWFFSRAGIRPWEFLHASNKRAGELGFADIDNDGVTDVLYRDPGGKLGYVKSGTAAGVTPLTSSPVPMKDHRFGDFDGDGLTDIFYTLNRQWQVWYGRTRAWTPAQSSSKPISELLYGEFDDVRGTDVVGVNASGWQYSSAATQGWEPLNSRLTSSFSKAVAADLDGNGKSDILVDYDGEKWRHSRDGRGPLNDVQYGIRGFQLHAPLKQLPIGRFDGGTEDRVVFFGRGDDRLLIWRGLLSGLPFSRRSSQNMR